MCHTSTDLLPAAEIKLCQNVLQKIHDILRNISQLNDTSMANDMLVNFCRILIGEYTGVIAQPDDSNTGDNNQDNMYYLNNEKRVHQLPTDRLINMAPFQNISVAEEFHNSTLEEESFKPELQQYIRAQLPLFNAVELWWNCDASEDCKNVCHIFGKIYPSVCTAVCI